MDSAPSPRPLKFDKVPFYANLPILNIHRWNPSGLFSIVEINSKARSRYPMI